MPTRPINIGKTTMHKGVYKKLSWSKRSSVFIVTAIRGKTFKCQHSILFVYIHILVIKAI